LLVCPTLRLVSTRSARSRSYAATAATRNKPFSQTSDASNEKSLAPPRESSTPNTTSKRSPTSRRRRRVAQLERELKQAGHIDLRHIDLDLRVTRRHLDRARETGLEASIKRILSGGGRDQGRSSRLDQRPEIASPPLPGHDDGVGMVSASEARARRSVARVQVLCSSIPRGPPGVPHPGASTE
jgi:hypothetical protein